MRRPTTFLVIALVSASVAAAVLVRGAPAATSTQMFVIPFSTTHQCTHEQVEGDTRVLLVVTTSDNPDGSIHVRTHQRTHGQTLLGIVSGDEYVFNEGSDVITEFDIAGGETGHGVIRTEFIHQGEDQALADVPGLDDLHQRTVVTITPVGGMTVEPIRSDCR
jgi:hypothetical protein